MKSIFLATAGLLLGTIVFGQYDKVDSLKDGMSRVTSGKKKGYINAQKKLVIPLVYDDANAFSEGLALVKKDGKLGYINTSNITIIPFIYEEAGDFYKGYAKVGLDEKFILIDKKGIQATVRKYDQIRKDGDYSIVLLDKKWGSIDFAGQEIIAPEYDHLVYKREGLLAAKKDRRWGFIDSLDQVVLPFMYTDANSFEDGMAVVSKDYSYGTIDKNGKNIISFQYDNLYRDEVTGGLWAKKKEKWGMVNLKDKELIPFKFDEVHDFTKTDDVYALVEMAKKTGMIDRKGKLLIPALYDEIYGCIDGYCGVGIDHKVGMVEISTGKEIIRPQYDDMGFFQSGLAMIKKTGSFTNPNDKTYERYGFVNIEGTQVVPLKYYEVRNFYGGMAAVRLSTKWGFVDSTGKEVIFPRYNDVSDFVNGKATVSQDDGDYYIDKKGRLSKKPAEEEVKQEAKILPKLPDDFFDFGDLFDNEKADANLTSGTGTNYQTYAKNTNVTPQMILREPEFPKAAIIENGKAGYRIVDVSQEGFGKENWVVTLSKNTLGEQSVYLLNKLSDLPEAVKQMTDKYPGFEITQLCYIHKKWVVVYSQHPPIFEHQLYYSGAASGNSFPRNDIKEKFNSGFRIKRLAYGEGGWAVLYTKDTALPNQSVRSWNEVNTTEIDSMKNEGYFFTNLVKAENKYYVVFSKLKGKPTWYYQQYSTKPNPTPEELLQSGFTLFRNFYLPRN